jgi:hypothetical protein
MLLRILPWACLRRIGARWVWSTLRWRITRGLSQFVAEAVLCKQSGGTTFPNPLLRPEELRESLPFWGVLARSRHALSLSWQITYNPGETVIREGEKGELFYVIKEGEGIVTVSKGSMTGNRSGQKKVLASFWRRQLSATRGFPATDLSHPYSSQPF